MGLIVNGSNVSQVANLGSVDPTLVFGPQRDSLYIVLPITITYTIIFITGVIGNILTCTVIVRNKSLRTATNYYLISLAISDLLLLISGMPQEVYSIWSKWPYIFGQTFCVLRGLAAETSTNASVLTITLFTIERYLAICHPFVSHKMSKLSRAIRHVIFLWICSFILALPQALQFGLRDHQGVIMCLQTQVIIPHSFEISTFFFFFAPMIAITVLYSLIGLRLKNSQVGRNDNQCENLVRHLPSLDRIRIKNHQSTERVVKMLVAVVVAFFVCWAPFHAQRLVAIYGTREDHHAKSPILLDIYSVLTYISGVFYYMSTCVNPIFYHIMSHKFRDAFKNSLANWCHRNNKECAQKTGFYTAMPHSQRTLCSSKKSSEKSNGNRSPKTRSIEIPEKTVNFPKELNCLEFKRRLTTEIELKNITNHSLEKILNVELNQAT
ncbi:pyrokinin-1 receptor-like [Battus philenor]|uniref:pyrokinin-1 receptor-like n=1 Tax=Battus philenor TaxID=42288 RepID=UPI0035D132A9